MTPEKGVTEENLPLSQTELIALLAMLSATVAFSIDAMLPSLPQMGAALSPDHPNRVQLVVGTFFVGLGVGTLFAGTLADALGRRNVAVGGAVIYTLAALLAAVAQDLETLLFARFVQGIGASGPRVAAIAIARDLFSGRRMAQIISYVIFVFTLTPIFAPALGWAIASVFGWRGVFVSFAVFAGILIAWLLLRLPETLKPEHVRAFRFRQFADGLREILRNRTVLLATAVQTLIFSTLFSALSSSQQVFEDVHGQGENFPLWFGLMGIFAAGANLVNARAVVRIGMREVVRRALIGQFLLTFAFLALQLTETVPEVLAFPMTFVWMTGVFCLAALGLGNMNALALEPLGHMAGLATSIIFAVGTIAAAAIAVPIGLAFDGTMLPLTTGVMAIVSLAMILLNQIRD